MGLPTNPDWPRPIAMAAVTQRPARHTAAEVVEKQALLKRGAITHDEFHVWLLREDEIDSPQAYARDVIARGPWRSERSSQLWDEAAVHAAVLAAVRFAARNHQRMKT